MVLDTPPQPDDNDEDEEEDEAIADYIDGLRAMIKELNEIPGVTASMTIGGLNCQRR